MNDLKKLIREVPDFPKPGILFYDITTLLKDAGGLTKLTEALLARYKDNPPDVVAGIEARGFMFGPILATHLRRGFVPVRKPGKLPAESIRVTYELEYGSDSLEMHKDAVEPGQRVLVVDDLLATGGTAAATCQLIEKLGGVVSGVACVIELDFLQGRKKLANYDVFSVLQYDK